jgi:hypothetical protein
MLDRIQNTYTFCVTVFLNLFMRKFGEYVKKLHSVALDDLENSVYQKLTNRPITSHFSINPLTPSDL